MTGYSITRLPLGRIAFFLAIGVFSGISWSIALMPIKGSGVLAYDCSRYAFSIGVAVLFVSLLFRAGQEYGLGIFFIGLLLAIFSWTLIAPEPPSQHAMVLLILFGAAIGIIVVAGLSFFLASRRTKRRLPGHRNDNVLAVAAPRRFGTGTLMLVVLAVSLLFAVAKWLNVPPPLSIWACSFLGIIGGMQATMNTVPRAVSVVTGAVLVPLSLAASWTTIDPTSHPTMMKFVGVVVTSPADFVFLAAHLTAFGAVCGYIGGVIVAGLFLFVQRSEHPVALRSAAKRSV